MRANKLSINQAKPLVYTPIALPKECTTNARKIYARREENKTKRS